MAFQSKEQIVASFLLTQRKKQNSAGILVVVVAAYSTFWEYSSDQFYLYDSLGLTMVLEISSKDTVGFMTSCTGK